MKKPWEQGYIPKPGKKPQYKGPATPNGWVREDRADCVEFRRMGATLWTHDLIIGQVGKPWKLWLDHSAGVFRQPDMKMTSFTALIAWYEVERANREPEMYQLPTDATVTGRNRHKAAAFALNYGMSAQRFTECAVQYRMPMDFKSLEERTAAWMEKATQLHSTAGTGSPASSSTSEAPSGETACSGQPTSARTPGTEDG
uniref:Terminase n=1 Tax=viral metagenome TaxID=1070528 RepID=A0A6M3M5X6_9ZZZZ